MYFVGQCKKISQNPFLTRSHILLVSNCEKTADSAFDLSMVLSLNEK